MVEAAIIAATTTVLITIGGLVFIWRLCSMADKSRRNVHVSFKRLIAVEVRYGDIDVMPTEDSEAFRVEKEGSALTDKDSRQHEQ